MTNNFNIKDRTIAWFIPEPNSDWTNEQILSDYDPSSTGNRLTRVTFRGGGGRGYFYLEASMYAYDPNTQGPLDLSKYDFSVDIKECLIPPADYTTYRLTVRQSNIVYACRDPFLENNYAPQTSYQSFSQSGLVDDFSSSNFDQYASNSTPDFQPFYNFDGTSHPNFIDGSRIKFGILVKADFESGGIDRTFETHIDNFECRTRETDPTKAIKRLGILRLTNVVGNPNFEFFN